MIGRWHAEFLLCPGEQLGYRQRTACVGAPPKQLPLTKAGVIGYFCSDPIWLFESLFFIRKLYLSHNNPCQIAFVNVDGPCEPSIRDPVPRFFDAPFPADRMEHRFGIGFWDFILKFGSNAVQIADLSQ